MARVTLRQLPLDAPAGTPVFVVEDDRSITLSRTRSAPWSLQMVGRVRRISNTIGRGAESDKVVWIVQLERRSGGFLVERCFLPPTLWPIGDDA